MCPGWLGNRAEGHSQGRLAIRHKCLTTRYFIATQPCRRELRQQGVKAREEENHACDLIEGAAQTSSKNGTNVHWTSLEMAKQVPHSEHAGVVACWAVDCFSEDARAVGPGG